MNISVAKKTRTRKSREERIAEIIATATEIFTREGFSELSLRRVAKEIGVRLSTVQHYFETKEDLISSMLKTQVNSYSNRQAMLGIEAGGDPEKQFSSYVRSLLEENRDPNVCGFFTQLWAMGFQHEESRELLAYMYEVHRQDLADFIQQINPTLDDVECLGRATMISSMIEGSLIHMGCGLPQRPEFVGLRERMHDQILAIACS